LSKKAFSDKRKQPFNSLIMSEISLNNHGLILKALGAVNDFIFIQRGKNYFVK